jgi:hypothetical protein
VNIFLKGACTAWINTEATDMGLEENEAAGRKGEALSTVIHRLLSVVSS